MSALEYFQQNFRMRESTNGWWEFECPVCGRFKGAVNFDFQYVKCWRGCYSTHLPRFLHSVMGMPYAEAIPLVGERAVRSLPEQEHSYPTLCFPDGYRPLWYGSGQLHQRALDYLTQRGLDTTLLGSMGWGYVDSGEWLGRIIIPYYSHGLLKYYTGRTFIGDALRYRNPPTEASGVGKSDYFYNEDALERGKVYLCEGAIDAATIGMEGIASGGWSLSTQQLDKLMGCTHTVSLVPDVGNDPTGRPYRDIALELAQRRLSVGLPTSLCDLSPYSAIGKDANALGRDRVLSTEQPMTWEILFNIMYQ